MSLQLPALANVTSFLPLSLQTVGCPSPRRGGRAGVPTMAQSIPLLHLHTDSLASLPPCPRPPSFPSHFSLYFSPGCLSVPCSLLFIGVPAPPIPISSSCPEFPTPALFLPAIWDSSGVKKLVGKKPTTNRTEGRGWGGEQGKKTV